MINLFPTEDPSDGYCVRSPAEKQPHPMGKLARQSYERLPGRGGPLGVLIKGAGGGQRHLASISTLVSFRYTCSALVWPANKRFRS
ncbi:hypothetical protein CEXT_653631 [Caerostris extrusa]|uniref:Uncharacterized protein n=1 Tax=Caerostris extrusa TaxID=172846 RepID=A0AAV4NAG4_CAEEX|nr:hypothetical protein CEXT_653631 [Caerostris extrusa]